MGRLSRRQRWQLIFIAALLVAYGVVVFPVDLAAMRQTPELAGSAMCVVILAMVLGWRQAALITVETTEQQRRRYRQLAWALLGLLGVVVVLVTLVLPRLTEALLGQLYQFFSGTLVATRLGAVSHLAASALQLLWHTLSADRAAGGKPASP